MKKIIVILGPTAIGKTKLSIKLAKIYNGEVINADSTQIYKDLNIATAKITEEEKEGVIHHLINIKSIDEDYSVYDYQKDCRLKINEIQSRGKTPIIVGGTGLYIKAALYNYEFFEECPDTNDYDNYSNNELYEKLLSIDPTTTIHKNNRKRIIRALNCYNSNNKKITDNKKGSDLLYDAIFIGLTTSRDILYDRINKRVDIMVKKGLIEETEKLYKKGIRSKAVMTPIGYKELFEYFDGNITLEEAINLIKQRSRRYAKRQYTWNNNQMNVNWFDVDFNCFEQTLNEVKHFIDKNS
ncbi:MAG: tRNA (adenosine(37)-N6)-dimethylallyltransferase MiaA [bacterium]|nr:tRNA (adenosine(37)-N6)-dimethylallyltransferase MiaA [bacterium]